MALFPLVWDPVWEWGNELEWEKRSVSIAAAYVLHIHWWLSEIMQFFWQFFSNYCQNVNYNFKLVYRLFSLNSCQKVSNCSLLVFTKLNVQVVQFFICLFIC